MGLRELKAKRTRDAVFTAALELFERQGYEATTMEQIAEVAEIAPTTLYRYFPTKDSTLIDQLSPDTGTLADHLDTRPATESLDVALGHALRERLTVVDEHAEHVLRLRRQIDLVPTARARVWDSGYQEKAELEVVIARRCNVDPGELWVKVTANAVVMVAQIALDAMRESPEPGSAVAYAAETIRSLSTGAAVLPSLPPDYSTT